jgi:tRNA A-37 threonylcarbamoyl transferase component Bud32
MKPELNLPAGPDFSDWPNKIDTDQIIKAEARCLIVTQYLEDGTSAVLKMYYRRGLANFTRAKLLNFRAQREYRILRHLASCGIACTIPLFWTHGYCREYGFYEVLCTRYIPNAIALDTFLSSEPLKDQNCDFGPLFHLVYDMHRYGVYHGALSSKNILIDATGDPQPKYYLIDLARGWLFPGSILGQRIAGFDLRKLVRKIESHLGPGTCRPYLAQYGLGKEAIEKFYQDARRCKSDSRKQKRIKNTLKVKVFFYALLTQINLRLR